jgi:hypothetical protein
MILLNSSSRMREGALRRLFLYQESSTLKQTWDLRPMQVKPMQTPTQDTISGIMGAVTCSGVVVRKLLDSYSDKDLVRKKGKEMLLNRKPAKMYTNDRATGQFNKCCLLTEVSNGVVTRTTAPPRINLAEQVV